MNLASYLSNKELVRTITTTKQYIKIDTNFSCNHSASKNTFTNNLEDPKEGVFYIDLTEGLVDELGNLLKAICNQWTTYCYHYDWDTFLAEFKLKAWQFTKLKRYVEA